MVFTLTSGVYLHTAYAQASDGSVGFSTESATDAAYLGQYTDASATDATDPSRYTWTPIDLGAGAELVEEDADEVDDGTDGLIDLLGRELYDTGQFAPDTQATGDRKVQTYFQAEEPNPEEFVFGVGDLWHDTDDRNHLYRWDGTAWADAQDGGIGAAAELAQAVQTALAGLTKVQDDQVLIDGDKVYLSAAFVKSIFAQDITATGTIIGAKLIGAVLSGGSIDISGTFDGYTGTSEGYIRTLGDESGSPQLILGMGENRIKITDDAMESIVLDGPMIYIGTPGAESVTSVHNLYVNGELSVSGVYRTYTSFSGGVISTGSLTVTKKAGVCYISGSITLSKSISDWTTILTESKVPRPEHGELIPFNIPAWGSSYTAALRGKITADGGLQIRLGAAREYVFSLSYPIE